MLPPILVKAGNSAVESVLLLWNAYPKALLELMADSAGKLIDVNLLVEKA